MPHSSSAQKPEFFIVGAPKCGTTTLYSWLKQHPDIFMPTSKEPHFFAQNLSNRYCRIRDEESYLSLFFDAHENQVCGEASVLYGFYPESIKAILEFNPKAKIIFMLRHPIDMIISYHGQLLVNLEEDQKAFESAWRLSEPRKNGANLPKTMQDLDLLDYAHIGALGHHMKNIIDIVPEDQRLFLLLDDMAEDPAALHARVLAFLGVQSHPLKSYEKENEAASLRWPWLQTYISERPIIVRWISGFLKKLGFKPSQIIQKINRKKREKVEIDQMFRKELEKFFKSDIEAIEKFFNRKFS